MVTGADRSGGSYEGSGCENTAEGDERFFAETSSDFLPATFFVKFARDIFRQQLNGYRDDSNLVKEIEIHTCCHRKMMA